MAWSGGTFTRANGTTEWQDDAALGVGIEAAIHDAQDNDLATGINNCLTKDGQNTPTADLPMGGYKHTGVASASGSGQYTTYNQLQDSSFDATVAQVAVNNTSTNAVVAINKYGADTNPAFLRFQKSRGATVGSNTIVAANDVIGSIDFNGNNGTDFIVGARIRATVETGVGTGNDMPVSLGFSTTPDGSGTSSIRMTITSAGRVGIGRADPESLMNLYGADPILIVQDSGTSGATADARLRLAESSAIGNVENYWDVHYDAGPLKVKWGTTEIARFATTGVGINTSVTPQAYLHVGGASPSSVAPATYPGTIQIDERGISNLTTTGGLEFKGSASSNGYGHKIVGFDDGTLVFAGRSNNAAWTQTMSITPTGAVIFNGNSSNPIASNLQGSVAGTNGAAAFSTLATAGVLVNRANNDGNLVEFYQAGTIEGAISVTGTTITYGAFCGSHWSQLSNDSKPVIPVGTVMESIDELCFWPGENEDRLPKVKISDTVKAKAVYGVFMSWDNDWTVTNDMSVASLGAYFVRVPAGTVLQIGDLLESAGNGMAQVQADDIIRSSTIGKVTALTQSHIEADGSFCVPTVLYCG